MFAPLAALALADWIDPDRAFDAGFAQHPHIFWLDAGPEATAGWSWVGSGHPERDADAIRRVVTARPRGSAITDEAGPFRGGWVGWLGYDDAAGAAGAPVAAADTAAPQAMWLRADRFLAFDHGSHRVWAFAPPAEVAAFADEAAGWGRARERAHATRVERGTAIARHRPDEYAMLIERCRDAIREGDAYQLCLTTRFSVAGRVDPVNAFRALRDVTPSHHGGLVRSAETALVSASPERFLDVGDGVVRTHPIKGTRPRGTDAASDAVLAEELQTSPKERAENVMIVDLMRNDLSRVCEAGSVNVDRLLEVESYPAVHQLVSTVSGTLEEGTTVGRLLDAAFPAGSMTGAPKLSAMTILHGLEGAARGVFAGCFGWVGEDGSLDLAMIIRSIVTHPGGAYVGAGGGITWGSDAAAEVAEVGIKAAGPLRALGAQLPAGW